MAVALHGVNHNKKKFTGWFGSIEKVKVSVQEFVLVDITFRYVSAMTSEISLEYQERMNEFIEWLIKSN